MPHMLNSRYRLISKQVVRLKHPANNFGARPTANAETERRVDRRRTNFFSRRACGCRHDWGAHAIAEDLEQIRLARSGRAHEQHALALVEYGVKDGPLRRAQL